MDDVAAGAGVAKTTVYRRWPSKRDLVLDAVTDLLGALPPLEAPTLEGDVASVTRWYAARLGDPGLRAGLLGLYAESSADPAVAALLRQRLHEPYLPPVRARLGDRADEAEDLLHLVVGGVLHATVTRGQALDGAAVERLAAAAGRLVVD
jgi:AcrR family transcriptional regulator